ncbi:MAG: DEAD/DEAH box helicase [Chthoniobacterales bacterium]
MSFQNSGLSKNVVHGVQRLGFLDPTPIQIQSFPTVLSGRDLIASAQTGTGKTAAFALPILSRIEKKPPGKVRCLVLEPTRELAMQVESAFIDYGAFTDIRVGLIHGGVGYTKQRKAISEGYEVLAATPGRMLDFIKEKEVDFSGLEILVLDEVDRMLDMGFLPSVRQIIQACPTERQTLLYSATVPDEIGRLATWCLRNPEKIEIGVQRSPAETVTHAIYPVAMDQKFNLLLALLEKTHYHSVLIFSRTKDGADRIANQLKQANHSVAVLHSNRNQTERVEALEGFKAGRFEIMVATDIAARGIDIAGVSHVINYDVPQHPEDYVHRIGRTGRAQTEGDAFTIMTVEELDHVASIERFIKQKIKREKLEGFQYAYTSLFDEKAARSALRNTRGVATGKGMRFSSTARRRRRS